MWLIAPVRRQSLFEKRMKAAGQEISEENKRIRETSMIRRQGLGVKVTHSINDPRLELNYADTVHI